MAAKNKPLSAKSKPKKDSKSKKDKESSGPPKAEITVILTEEQAAKYLKSAKVITAQELARQAGVKASAANVFLKEAVRGGKATVVGGHSGHWIYQTAS